ncbi:MAG: hypothetical protein A3I31_00540 [Candidatus Colwellbacteria bacterium RIFCSPLOWO2_02_FULL_44_20b]|uniref:Uncharacterized protein n=1 Tax=Candidatus Colwellbacteria bacterium RIFCSPLOWO2_02_FULL_44_20b TaxID=1797691 RepID=A0A1G1Z6F4_9BACT|nr:MAG: hypothetical protein A3I31_00540 [Candidatus Colwellbacteria bacterium RIFCSPLOWO2_02_FULL_44_20b]
MLTQAFGGIVNKPPKIIMKVSNVRKITYRSTDSQGLPVPFLPLQGKHLEQYGFYLGQQVAVDYQRGRITVSLIINNLERGDKYGYQERLPVLSDQLLREKGRTR